jgi:GTP-binding protein
VWFGDTKINIVDTPGHADFGGEVERVLKMVDGAMLLVDASEGPLPQTRFVLGKALEAGLVVMVCIKKIDRPDARAEEVLDEVYDLFIDLGADEEQIGFPVLYACAKEGYCHLENKQEPGDLRPMLEAIISHIPAPKGDPDALPQILVTQLDYDKYVGRIAIGRIINGTVHRQQNLLLVTANGQKPVRIVQLYNYEGLARVEADTVAAGEILAIAGIDELDIGDTLTDIENPQPLARVVVEEPTIGVLFMANDGPLAGLDGKYMTARQIRDRLEKECQTNVALKIDPDSPSDALRLFGRGELQIAILIEQMRREGWELCVSKPEVVIREEEDGTRLEPFETAELDFPEEYMGVVSEKLNLRKGRMTTMKMMGSGRVRVEFLLPARGLIGFRGEYLSDTRGQGIVNTLFAGFQPYAGHFLSRKNGSMVCDRMGQTKAYALFNLQPRGKLFVGSGTDVYEGMIVGENSRENDLNVNATKAKQLTNIRSAGADEKLILAPPLQLTLEKAMEFIADDELMEVTPNHIRLRKRVLAANMRSVVRGERKKPKKKRG